jgi:hypothetical protein
MHVNKQDGNGQYIWLRYATQYAKDGRTHTVEMGIPVPLGASAEQREELLREAETGMSQLVQHVEQRASQVWEYVQSTHNTSNQGATTPTSQSSPTTKTVSTASSSTAQAPASLSIADQSTPVQARLANRSASVPVPQATNQPTNGARTAPPTKQELDFPQNRSHVGASMPSSLSPNSMGGNLQIPEFVSYINENMHLKPKQAMDLLGVKSLSGVNLRDALENLKKIMAQNPQQPSQRQDQPAKTVSEASPLVSLLSPLPSQSTTSTRQNAPLPSDTYAVSEEQEHEANMIEMQVPRLALPTRVFDEEITEEDELKDLEALDNVSPSSAFSPEQLNRARDKIQSLRETQGGEARASSARLQVLRNAADADVSDEQLLALVAGIWNIQAMKKLQVDQVEVLISWAKQDYFLEEVKTVLAVLEEEHYARGNR